MKDLKFKMGTMATYDHTQFEVIPGQIAMGSRFVALRRITPAMKLAREIQKLRVLDFRSKAHQQLRRS